ncbi:hypothetical protein [Argonema antarcticum]|uniref:hypothetical protein n=1 Tax=Argonema antarcticum TaxID=2942763 RepID=UPI002011957B|nr:hypothetical protein [Argonema antarcticum]MCL1474607.1 hypothetical protein [Argonema antarcticum A004/B2]
MPRTKKLKSAEPKQLEDNKADSDNQAQGGLQKLFSQPSAELTATEEVIIPKSSAEETPAIVNEDEFKETTELELSDDTLREDSSPSSTIVSNSVDDEKPDATAFARLGKNSYSDPIQKLLTYIHFWGGERGGAGKSTGGRAMLHFLLEIIKDGTFYLVETDRSRPDVKAYYGDRLTNRCVDAFFSEAEFKSNSADKIFELALQANVVVNLPAQIAVPFDEWVDRNCLSEMTAEKNILMVMWFVCSGEEDSVDLFFKSLEKYGSWMQHVFVRNEGVCPDEGVWERIAQMPKMKQVKEQYNFPVISLPKFYMADRDALKANPIPFEEALKRNDIFTELGKKRTRKFLEKAACEFNKTGLFNDSN